MNYQQILEMKKDKVLTFKVIRLLKEYYENIGKVEEAIYKQEKLGELKSELINNWLNNVSLLNIAELLEQFRLFRCNFDNEQGYVYIRKPMGMIAHMKVLLRDYDEDCLDEEEVTFFNNEINRLSNVDLLDELIVLEKKFKVLRWQSKERLSQYEKFINELGAFNKLDIYNREKQLDTFIKECVEVNKMVEELKNKQDEYNELVQYNIEEQYKNIVLDFSVWNNGDFELLSQHNVERYFRLEAGYKYLNQRKIHIFDMELLYDISREIKQLLGAVLEEILEEIEEVG